VIPERWADAPDEPLRAMFLLTGVGLLGMAVAVAWRLGGCRGGPAAPSVFPFSRTVDRVLALWFLLELAGSIAFSPFMAARRVLTLIVVVTILIARYAALTRRPGAGRGPLLAITAFSALLGLGYFLVDCEEATAQKEGVDRAVRWIGERNAGNRVWYAGHWGFQHYADREGLTPLVPGASSVRVGDWIVIPDPHVAQQNVSWKRPDVESAFQIELEDALPYRTLMNYYAGTTPILRRRGPRLSVQIYRARADFVPGRG
jgi:hypothetical protein